MIADHYATLGVSARASRAAIRAAYLDLIRRYHPDVNPSAEAEARVRAITAAYAVLGSPQKRARYDAGRFQQRAARTTAPAYQRPHRRRLTPWIVLAASVAAILLIVPRLVAPPVYPAERIVRTAALAPPRTAAPEADVAAISADQRSLCSSPPVSDLVKRALFRRAARLGGKDPVAFDRLAAYSTLRFDLPVPFAGNPAAARVTCSAAITIDLPPEVQLGDRRQSLTDTIVYALKAPGRGSRGMISLTDAGSVAERLATVARSVSAAPQIAEASVGFPEAATSGTVPALPVAPRPVRVVAPPLRAVTPPMRAVAPPVRTAVPAPVAARSRPRQKPSFSCHSARSWAAIAVCNSDTLARLDRQMAALYGNAVAAADPSKMSQLQRSDQRFLARRDACSSEACVQSAYVAGIRDIQQIAAGPPRRF